MSIERARELRKRMGVPEAKLWTALRTLRLLGFHFRRQVPMGRYIVDFACHHACLVIEVDGKSHGTAYAMRSDALRDEFIGSQGYDVVRISNEDVVGNLAGVMELIGSALADRPRTPTLVPSPQGGGRLRRRMAKAHPNRQAAPDAANAMDGEGQARHRVSLPLVGREQGWGAAKGSAPKPTKGDRF